MPTLSKQLLLESAIRLIRGGGVADLNIRDLARHAGCSIGAIYYHFSTKNELMLAVYEYYWAESYKLDLQGLSFVGSLIEFIDLYYTLERKRDDFCMSGIVAAFQPFSYEDIERYHAIEQGLRANVLDKFMSVLVNDTDFQSFPWNERLTKEAFCLFVIDSIESALLAKKPDCGALKEILKSLYRA